MRRTYRLSSLGLIILILVVLTVSVAGFIGGRFSLIPIIQDQNAAVEQLMAAQDEARREQYHRGVYDLCIVVSYSMNWPNTCNQVVSGAHAAGWYDQETTRFVWPPAPAADDGN